MSTTFKFGSLTIDAVNYGSAGNAVLGIRDSGKTYSATLFAEHLFDAGVPFVAFDPIGVWRFLRVPGHGRGYPIVVAGGQHGDLPLSPHSAPAIVEAAMQNGVSLVIDLFSLELSKADWKRIVRDSVRLMLHRNSQHGLRHVFIEEASEFAPQRVIDGDVYAEIEKLARMGGNSRLGYTLINQRAEEVNKAVLELCDNLFLHRQKGRNSLTALSKWLDVGAVKDHKQIIDTLSTLPTGECWAWLAGSERPVHVKVPQKHSLHPDRRVMRGDAGAEAKPAVDVGQFVETMRGTLKTVEEEAKANDPKLLKARIRELEQELAKGGGASKADLAAEYARGRAEGFDAALSKLAPFIDRAATIQASLDEHLGGFVDDLRRATRTANVPAGEYLRNDEDHASPAARTAPAPADYSAIQKPYSPPANRGNGSAGNPEIGAGGLRRMLIALAQRPQGMSAKALGVRAGMSSSSGTFGTYLGRGRSEGWIEGDRSELRITALGIKALGRYEPLPTGAGLLNYWIGELGNSGAARLLSALADAYPRALPRDAAAERAGLSPGSGTFGTYLGKLRTLELVTGRGELRASEELFG